VLNFDSMGTNRWPRLFYSQPIYARIPLEVKTQERRGADPGSQGHAKRVRSPPLAWVGWATDPSEVSPRSERSQLTSLGCLPPSPETGLSRANPPTSLQCCVPHTYTPHLSVRPSRLRPRGGPSRSLFLSLFLSFSLFLSLALSHSLFLSLFLCLSVSLSLFLSLALSHSLFLSIFLSLILSLSLSQIPLSPCLAQISYAPIVGP